MPDGSHSAAVIGGGPAGLMAAEVLSGAGVSVTVYERMPSLGRKLLLAGRGGLNLTHSEELEGFLSRYGDRAGFMNAAIQGFPPAAAREWCETLGQKTFVGSSGRVFPVAMKASPLLRAWLRALTNAGVTFRTRHQWTGWDGEGRMTFNTPDGPIAVSADAAVLALGGASWPKLGSDGSWCGILGDSGIGVAPLAPSNCGFAVDWSETFRSRFAGKPLKRIAISFGAFGARGEAVVTEHGIEGGAIYALSSKVREEILAGGAATLRIDLRPDVPAEVIEKRLGAPRGKQSLSNFLRKAVQLSPVAIGLMHEAALKSGAPLGARGAPALAELTKALPLLLGAPFPIARAISSAGGVRWDEVDERLMLRKRPGTFVAGEMLDWEAPTGGYLLQGCLATGAAAGRGALAWLAREAG